MSEWFPAVLDDARPVGDRLVRLTLSPAAEVVSSFTIPGQYQRLRVAGHESTFAIASRPGEARFEYLIRPHGAAATRLVSLSPGAPLEASRAEGHGFPLGRAAGHPLILIATGSGFAPIKSVLDHLILHRTTVGPVRALIGLRSEAERPPPSDLERWADAQLDVQFTLSQAPEAFTGRRGRVQQHLEALPVADEPFVFLCGQKHMVADVTHALAQRGVPKHHIALNFGS